MKAQTIAIFLVGLACAALAAPSVDTSVLKVFQTKETANILISFKGANTAGVRRSTTTLNFTDRTQRIQYLYDNLKRHADETQGNVLGLLSNLQTAESAVVRQLWITNQVYIKNANRQLVEELLKREEISKIEEEKLSPMVKPVSIVEHPLGYKPTAGEQWGILAVDAPTVWASGYKGKGVVIANIDTGVRGTHEALKDGFRRLNGWYDAENEEEEPVDDYGHGTHTMGTMVGRTNGIGVAPEADWIACRACTDWCSDAQFILCGQWAVCPTDNKLKNPRCDLAPHAISNSWHLSNGEDDLYDDVLATWIAADIAPIFAVGNLGSSCSSVNSPGDSQLAVAVGATTSTNQLASFSSVGPTVSGKIKPDIAAPGNSVLSAYNSNDRSYTTMSGTSMATPHVVGLTALLYNINANLTVSDIRSVLTEGAKPGVLLGRTCGGTPDSEYPNNHYGHGIVSASASAERVNRMMKRQF
ncbi:unnamed protein product [Allacma fusca]|uniref:Peptidase S8/S53 domain-containing protein n=1 Tax=Allacma fusca TaxID=39272 RepID=A0A8J2NMP0_9HEXA|nr:unnamed protein product [Allacma fusca]